MRKWKEKGLDNEKLGEKRGGKFKMISMDTR
jgi:hypothetical protein